MEDLIIDEIHQMCDYLDKQTDHPLKINLVFNLSVVNALWTLITGYILSACLISFKVNFRYESNKKSYKNRNFMSPCIKNTHATTFFG